MVDSFNQLNGGSLLYKNENLKLSKSENSKLSNSGYIIQDKFNNNQTPTVLSRQITHDKMCSMSVSGDFTVSGKLNLNNNWTIEVNEDKLQFMNNGQEIYVLSRNSSEEILVPNSSESCPPEYSEANVFENSEIELLGNLQNNCKLRNINGMICLETRSRFSRTFSKDSRNKTLEDLKRIIFSLKEISYPDILLTKVLHGINVLKTTTYKNDKNWIKNVDLLLSDIKNKNNLVF